MPLRACRARGWMAELEEDPRSGSDKRSTKRGITDSGSERRPEVYLDSRCRRAWVREEIEAVWGKGSVIRNFAVDLGRGM